MVSYDQRSACVCARADVQCPVSSVRPECGSIVARRLALSLSKPLAPYIMCHFNNTEAVCCQGSTLVFRRVYGVWPLSSSPFCSPTFPRSLAWPPLPGPDSNSNIATLRHWTILRNRLREFRSSQIACTISLHVELHSGMEYHRSPGSFEGQILRIIDS